MEQGGVDVNGPSRKSWAMAIILAVGYVLSFVDRQILNLLLEQIRTDLAITDVQASLLVGAAFALFYVIAGLPLGWLADRVSRRGIIAASLVVWTTMTALCGAASNYFQLFLARVGVGVGEAGYSPASVSMLGDHYPDKQRSRAFGIYTSAIPLGMGLALIGGGALMAAAPAVAAKLAPWIGEYKPWQIVFMMVALPGFLLAPFVLLLREPTRGKAANAEVASESVVRYVWERRGTYLPLMTGLSALAVLGIGYGAWIPTLFMRTYGWDIPQIGYAYGLIALICGPLGALLGGWMCDRLLAAGRRNAHWIVLTISLPSLGFCYALAPLMPSAAMALALLIPGTMAGAAPSAASHAALVQITDAPFRARVFALYTFIQSVLGLALGPTLVALLTDHLFVDPAELRYSMTVVAVLAALAGTVLIYMCGAGYRRIVDQAAVEKATA